MKSQKKQSINDRTSPERLEYIAYLVDLAKKLNLSGIEYFDGHSIEELAMCYNGVGAEWMPQSLVDKLTKYFHVYESAFLIHDAGYMFADIDSRSSVDNALIPNLTKCAWNEYGFGIKLIHALPLIYLVYSCCKKFGEEAWLNAHGLSSCSCSCNVE